MTGAATGRRGALAQRLDALDWSSINQNLLENGFAIAPPFLRASEIRDLRRAFGDDALFRSTIDMKQRGYGQGVYRYFRYPLLPLMQTLRETIYEKIAGSAAAWSERLGAGVDYPPRFAEFAEMMRGRSQTKPTPLILRYGPGDFNCLHQDLDNDLIFPYQAVLGLCEMGRDYEGGHLVFTQRRPRQQTVPYVLTVPRGGGVIFASKLHASPGKRGFRRAVFKHGVSRIESGERYTVGIVFHDYRS